ncbi:hypothetical protein C8R45DRAFT_1223861 [Mycena sanguinolenta]|nr:hypothetical protein C8R45DRAFT_1223861 [Mycena sanguinolenta]
MTPLIAIMAGMVIADVIYGFYLNLFITSTYLFCRRFTSRRGDPLYRSIIFVSTFFLFASVTATCILLTVRVFQGFILFEAGPTAFFEDQSQATSVALNTVTLASMFFNDFLMIYRLYIVWCRTKPVMILPGLAWIGFTVCAVLVVVFRRITPDLALVTSLTPSFVFTLLTNTYCTVFIVWKIYNITRACLPEGGADLRDLLGMLVESSALYTSWALLYAVTHQIDNNAQYLAVATLPPIAGIANALVQTRIAMGNSVESSPPPSQSMRFRDLNTQSTMEHVSQEDLESKPVRLEVSSNST